MSGRCRTRKGSQIAKESERSESSKCSCTRLSSRLIESTVPVRPATISSRLPGSSWPSAGSELCPGSTLTAVLTAFAHTDSCAPSCTFESLRSSRGIGDASASCSLAICSGAVASSSSSSMCATENPVLAFGRRRLPTVASCSCSCSSKSLLKSRSLRSSLELNEELGEELFEPLVPPERWAGECRPRARCEASFASVRSFASASLTSALSSDEAALPRRGVPSEERRRASTSPSCELPCRPGPPSESRSAASDWPLSSSACISAPLSSSQLAASCRSSPHFSRAYTSRLRSKPGTIAESSSALVRRCTCTSRRILLCVCGAASAAEPPLLCRTRCR
mmetsp:Transcript_14703/g.44137  ORF Transcript_14703/g.44137 Transcript_14703/m.44137 type:complete len:337 (+) Transcript_14703:2957-3967(+)